MKNIRNLKLNKTYEEDKQGGGTTRQRDGTMSSVGGFTQIMNE